MRMMEHKIRTVVKAEGVVKALECIMVNVGSPRSSRRKVLSHVAYSIILYATPTWSMTLKYTKYKKMLEIVQKES